MNATRTRLFVLAACLLLASCAQTGVPLPPSLELPRPPSDLRAIRKGNTVTLTWSEPVLTTDRQSVRYIGPTLICRTPEKDMTSCGEPVRTLAAPEEIGLAPGRKQPRQTVQAPKTGTDTLPDSVLSNDPLGEITYAVEVQNRNGRGAGPSNRPHVPTVRTLPPPPDFAAQLNDDGVTLTWTSAGEPPTQAGLQYRYRIYRREETAAKDALVGEVSVGAPGPAQFLDAAEWEKTYFYRVTAVTIASRPAAEVQVEGEDSNTIRVVAHDIFPPAVPAGLEAVYSGEGQQPFIDLIWAPVPSNDLAGYNVYRRETDGAVRKLNSEPVKTPSYRDSDVSPGKSYVYSVSAVDVRGNESARSVEASETVPENH